MYINLKMQDTLIQYLEALKYVYRFDYVLLS